MAVEESELVQRAVRGEGEAWAVLVEGVRDRLYCRLYPLVGQHEDTEDLVEEALLEAFQNLPHLRDPTRFRPWLYRITLGRAQNYLHRRRHRVVWEAELPEQEQAILEQGDGRDLSEDDLVESLTVRQALKSLLPGDRAVLVLRYVEDLSYGEVATALSISPAAVDSRLRRAKARLRQLLEAE
jgi:RNA polymerase sigma-70 factor (ECF subfamily)